MEEHPNMSNLSDASASPVPSSPSPAGVLLCGTLEKMHGLAGLWVKRYYVLTEDCLHRFLRAKGDSFFGKEIAHYDLSRIRNARVQDRYICFDLVDENGKLPTKRKIRCSSLSEAQTWVIAIVRARKRMRARRSDTSGNTPRRRLKRRSSISGNYQEQVWSPLAFGRRRNVLPSPFSIRIQQADGTISTKGNSLVPDEELCVGAVLNDSILVIEDINNRVVRLPLKSVSNIVKCERVLELKNSEIENMPSDNGTLIDDSSVKDEIKHVKIQLRFAADRRSARYAHGKGSASDRPLQTGDQLNRQHLGTLAISFMSVLGSFLFFSLADVEMSRPVRIWAVSMTFGTALLGFLALYDGLDQRRKAKERNQQLVEEQRKREVWRILYVALLDDTGEIARHNEQKMEEAKGEWDFERMMNMLGNKASSNLENPELLEDVPPEKETPQRFLNAEKDDPALARLRWRHTTWFRKKFGYNSVLDKPHPLFDVIKKYWPNYYYGKDRTGAHPVFFDKPSGVDLKKLYSLGITDSDLCYHYVWITEFCYKHLCANANDMASCITVYNMDGLDMSLLKGSKKKLITKTMKIFEQHYPERTFKVYILNAPGWFNWVAWPLVKQLANEQTLEKVKCFSTGGPKFMKSISTLVDPETLPLSFGGESAAPMNSSPSEIKMREFAHKVCADHGVKMITELKLMDEAHMMG